MVALVRVVSLWEVLVGAGLAVVLTAGGLLLTKGFLWVVLTLTAAAVRVTPAALCSTDLLLRGIICLGSFGRPFLESNAGEGGRLGVSRERTGPGGGFCAGGAEGLGSLQVGSGQTGLRG